MRKISLVTLAIFFNILCMFSQSSLKSQKDSTYQVDKKLKFEEANFVTGYYSQNGNHSAVTGGIGTEKLHDFANTFDLKLAKYVKKGVKHSIGLEVGVDHYTSASSDNIDPRINPYATTTTVTTTSSASRGGGSRRTYTVTNASSNSLTSASYSDTRFYPSVNWSIRNENKGYQLGINAAYSTEYDYKSKGMALNFSKTSKNQNREFSAKLQAFFDTWKVIYPYGLIPAGYGDGSHWDSKPVDYKPRNSYEASFSLAQVINRRFQMAILADVAYQQGLLATKYQRVYFTDGTVASETLPDNRLKIPVALRASYFVNDNLIVRSYYRFYKDDWGVTGHTFNIETPIKISSFASISPFYRYYTQQGSRYFAAYKEHLTTDAYYTSDYDLSTLHSHYFGAGIRVSPPEGVMGIKGLNMLEIRYGHYIRSTDLVSDAISINLKFK